MASSTTIIKAVTLVPGEKFTLPPGSKLIGSTDLGNLTSNCDIPELEELQCYVAIIGSNTDNGTSGAAYYEGEMSRLTGFRLNGTLKNFTSAYAANDNTGLFDLETLGEELMTAMPGIIATDFFRVTDDDRGGLNILLIQTIPSIGEKIQLVYKSSAAIDVSGVNNSEATSYIEFMTRAQAIALDYADVPVCPTGVPVEPEA